MSTESTSPTKLPEDGLYAYRGGSYATFADAVLYGGHYLICGCKDTQKAALESAKATCFATGDDQLKFVLVINAQAKDPDDYFNDLGGIRFASYAYYSTEGSEAFKKLGEAVRVHYLEVGEDDDEMEDLHLTITDEGIMIDLVGQASGEVTKSCAFDRDALVALCS